MTCSSLRIRQLGRWRTVLISTASIATIMPAAISPYSIVVAPATFLAKDISDLCISCSGFMNEETLKIWWFW
jgi:hypothetical protein